MAVHYRIDVGELADFVGSGQAWSETVQTPIYVDDLIRMAHGRAAKQFDIDAAAFAVSTQAINHMYEWGTAGINPAPGVSRLSPTSKTARLWVHNLGGGQRAAKTIGFEFRSSAVPVPLPTPRRTGVAGKWFEGNKAPRRRHFFYWKAPVMESGMAVTIKPVYAQALWIPLGGHPRTNNARAIERNFIMTENAVTAVPGEQFAGNFSAYWNMWWGKAGTSLITEIANAESTKDARVVPGAAGRRNARKYVSGVSAKGFSLAVDAAKSKAKTKMESVSRRRRAQRSTERVTGGKWD